MAPPALRAPTLPTLRALPARLSIVMPALNEAGGILPTLHALASFRAQGGEIILADGGSVDGTAEISTTSCDFVVSAPSGRAAQMNAGAAVATGDILLFLHADTRLPRDAFALVTAALADEGPCWGRFDVRFDSRRPMLQVVAAMINLRSRLTGVATGDQAMFMTRTAFDAAGGFPAIALMEDVAMSKRLRRMSPPACIREKVLTSARRWETHGIFRTILLMWRLRLAYYLGAAPEDLARRYR